MLQLTLARYSQHAGLYTKVSANLGRFFDDNGIKSQLSRMFMGLLYILNKLLQSTRNENVFAVGTTAGKYTF